MRGFGDELPAGGCDKRRAPEETVPSRPTRFTVAT